MTKSNAEIDGKRAKNYFFKFHKKILDIGKKFQYKLQQITHQKTTNSFSIIHEAVKH